MHGAYSVSGLAHKTVILEGLVRIQVGTLILEFARNIVYLQRFRLFINYTLSENGHDGGVAADCKSVTLKRRGFESLFSDFFHLDVYQLARLPALEAGGRVFESHHLDIFF